MKINVSKLEEAMARRCLNSKELQGAASLTTIQRIRSGQEIRTKTAGKIAKALDVDVSELLEVRDND